MCHSIKTVLFLVLIYIHTAYTAEPEKKIKSQRELVGAELTPANALFPRPVYGKNDKDEEVERATTTRSLFIILDDSEDLAGTLHAPMSAALLAMLYQKAGPILVSGSLLHNIFGRISGEKIKACKALEKTLIQKMKSTKKQSVQFIDNLKLFKEAHLNFEDLIHCSMINSFDPKEWIIKVPLPTKEWGSTLFLLIPKSYVQEKEKEWDAFQKSKSSEKAQPFDLEKAMGLKLKDMETIDESKAKWLARFINEKVVTLGSSKAFLELIDTGKLFVPQAEYTVSSEILVPQWVIYLTGHGHKNIDIAGLSSKDFRKVLTFLKKQIITKFFIYSTCYAGGINREQIYNEANKNIGDIYPFPIVAEGTAEAETRHSFDAEALYLPPGIFTVAPVARYETFVQLAERPHGASREKTSTPEATLYTELLRHIITGLDVFLGEEPETRSYNSSVAIANYPLIRLQNRDTFLPLIPTVEINERLAITRDPGETLNIQEYAKQKVKQFERPLMPVKELLVILSAQYIPFEVEIFSDRDESIYLISTLTGITKEDSMHIFETINTSYLLDSKDGFFEIFRHVNYAEDKIFLIHKLIDSEDRIYTDILIRIEKNTKKTTAYYTKPDGKKYTVELYNENVITTEKYLEPYEKAIKTIEARYNAQRKKTADISRILQKKVDTSEKSTAASPTGP